MIKLRTGAFLAILGVASCFSTTQAVDKDAVPAQVMMMGTFHFSNPGLDTVKTKQMNVLTEQNQRYLEAFTKRVANRFHPSHVLLECKPENEEKLNEQYRAYRQGDFELEVNENYQLGFRIASLSMLEKIHCYDDRRVQWNAKPMMEYMASTDGQSKARFDEKIKRITATIERMHQTLDLGTLLKQHNEQAFDNKNMGLYLLTNDVGTQQEPVGADAAASWWTRNFRMYANVQRVAQPGSRVFVLGGQGHTAILKSLLTLDERRQPVDVTDYL